MTELREKLSARQQRIAIAAKLNEGLSVRQVAAELGCSKTTVQKVKTRMDDPNQDPADDLREQNGKENYYTTETKDAILQMRNETGFGPRLMWSLLKRDPEKWGITDPKQIPGEDFIHKLLSEHGLTQRMVGAKDKRGFPIDFEDKPGVIALDEWGPWNVRGERMFLVTCQDRYTKLSFGVPVLKKGSADTWIKAQRLARKHILNDAAPHALWIDNGIGMAIANGFTPQPVRFALSQGTRVVFNAPHQPWKNGRLENWHWRQEVEYWRLLDGTVTPKEAEAGFIRYCNFYNVDRPHGGLKDLTGERVRNTAPADLSPWYLPLTMRDYAQAEPEQRLEPQRGVIDMVRMVRNNGRIELHGQEEMRVSEIFAGAWLRVRMYSDPDAAQQIGEVIWQRGQQKQPLVVATFNHMLDRSRKKGQPFVTDVRPVDFSDHEEHEYITGRSRHVDEYALDRAAARIGKRSKSKYTDETKEASSPYFIDPETGEKILK